MTDNDKKKRLTAALNKINKTYGAGTVTTASEAQKMGKLTKRVLPTTSLEFNDMLGGGMCGIVELYGQENSGKTSLAIETIAYNQQLDPDFVAAWLETEGSVTEDILRTFNVDMDRLVFWRQEDAGSAENALEVSRGLLTQDVVDCVVVNSVAGLSPKTEGESDLEKQNVALTARLLSKYLRIITGIASKNKVTVIFINQLRDNVGVMYGNPSTTTGGRALRYYASQRVDMRKVKIQATDPIADAEGLKINCTATKNRLIRPDRKCSYYAIYGRGIDSTVSIPPLLIENNIIEAKGAWLYYKDTQGNTIVHNDKPCQWCGKNALLNDLRTDKSLKDMLVSKLNGLSEKQTAEEIRQHELENEQAAKEMAALDAELASEEESE